MNDKIKNLLMAVEELLKTISWLCEHEPDNILIPSGVQVMCKDLQRALAAKGKIEEMQKENKQYKNICSIVQEIIVNYNTNLDSSEKDCLIPRRVIVDLQDAVASLGE